LNFPRLYRRVFFGLEPLGDGDFRHAALRLLSVTDGACDALAAVIIILLCAADKAYMGGANTRLVMSAANSAVAAINQKADDLFAYLKRS
jgi:hypothetical protein